MVKTIVIAGVFGLFPALVFSGDKVVIGGYENYPTASCKIQDKYYLIPNGTTGEIIKWNSLYSDGKTQTIFAQIDMIADSEVKFLTGPQKGKSCSVNHMYIQLKQ